MCLLIIISYYDQISALMHLLYSNQISALTHLVALSASMIFESNNLNSHKKLDGTHSSKIVVSGEVVHFIEEGLGRAQRFVYCSAERISRQRSYMAFEAKPTEIDG